MSIRSGVGAALRKTVGRSRTEQLRRREVSFRRGIAERIAPGSGVTKAPEEPAPAAVVPEKPATAPTPPEKPSPPRVDPAVARQRMIDALGEAGIEGMGAGSRPPEGLSWVSMDPYEHILGSMSRHDFLKTMHQCLQPRTYFEIGIDRGQSLTFSRCRSIAVDPSFNINRSIHCDVQIFQQTSDDYFASQGNVDHFDGTPIDMAFIDGMHLAEFALRDVMNVEKLMSPGGVIILDDMMPRNSLEAQRVRRTGPSWTGDVYKVHDVLQRYRPDLTLVPVNTEPTGSYLIAGLDPTSTVLDEVYEEILPELSAPDPQTVKPEWLRRSDTYLPSAVVGSSVWEQVRELRNQGAPAHEYSEVWARLVESVTPTHRKQ